MYSISSLLKRRYTTIFQGDSSHSQLGELRKFKHDLEIHVNTRVNMFQKLAVSLALGSQAHMLAFLGFLGRVSLGNLYVFLL